MYCTPTAVGTQILCVTIHDIPHWSSVCRLTDRLQCSRSLPWRLCCIVTVLSSNRSRIPSSVLLESGLWITCSSNEHVSDYKRPHTFLARQYNSPSHQRFSRTVFWWHNNKQWLWPTRSPKVNMCNFLLCGLLKDKSLWQIWHWKLPDKIKHFLSPVSPTEFWRAFTKWWRVSDSRGPAFSEP